MTQPDNANTFTIIVDDEVAVFLEQEKISDPNAYMIELLEAEKRRQDETGEEPNERSIQKILDSTPDASGNSEAHFEHPTT